MTDSIIHLTPWDLAIAASLLLVAGAVSLLLRLGLEKSLAVAAARTVVQLLLIGYVLRWVFRIDDWPVLAPVVLFMALAATWAAVGRTSRSFGGAAWRVFLTILFHGLFTTVVVTMAVIGVKPWWRAQYMIPLLGMVLGNSLTAVSLCLDTLLETFAERRDRVEAELSLGATRWEAARQTLGEGVRRGMIPIINTMMVVGVVSLPGMMTGQILAGADPLDAVKYQVVVIFMICAATALCSMTMALLVYRRLFNARHQLVEGVIVKG